MFAVVVTFRLKPGRMARFLSLMVANAETSLAAESGCRQFDVCTDPDRPDVVFLYELYDGPAAFDDHVKSAHFLAFSAETESLVSEKSVQTYREVRQ